MLDQSPTFLSREHTRDDERVEQSARRLFDRLNPPVRDRDIAPDAPDLPVYDWEIAKDTGIGLDAARSALRSLDGSAVALGTINNEHSVIALVQPWAAEVA